MFRASLARLRALFFLFYRFDGDEAPPVSENFQKIKRADAEKLDASAQKLRRRYYNRLNR